MYLALKGRSMYSYYRSHKSLYWLPKTYNHFWTNKLISRKKPDFSVELLENENFFPHVFVNQLIETSKFMEINNAGDIGDILKYVTKYNNITTNKNELIALGIESRKKFFIHIYENYLMNLMKTIYIIYLSTWLA